MLGTPPATIRMKLLEKLVGSLVDGSPQITTPLTSEEGSILNENVWSLALSEGAAVLPSYIPPHCRVSFWIIIKWLLMTASFGTWCNILVVLSLRAPLTRRVETLSMIGRSPCIAPTTVALAFNPCRVMIIIPRSRRLVLDSLTSSIDLRRVPIMIL